jgi:hypothetical protein
MHAVPLRQDSWHQPRRELWFLFSFRSNAFLLSFCWSNCNKVLFRFLETFPIQTPNFPQTSSKISWVFYRISFWKIDVHFIYYPILSIYWTVFVRNCTQVFFDMFLIITNIQFSLTDYSLNLNGASPLHY